MFVCLGLLALGAGGCEAGSGGGLAILPWHRLDFSPGRAAPGAEAASPRSAQPPVGASESDWAVAEYRPWRYIVIHHSATDGGSAATFDRYHRSKGWDELGYHFVITNGDGGPDGRVEVGQRWRQQKWGAHTGGTPNNEYNNYGIGICLVGDFQSKPPSAAQLAALSRLVNYLAARYDIPPANVIGHRDAPSTSTRCPGNVLHGYIHSTLQPELARSPTAGK